MGAFAEVVVGDVVGPIAAGAVDGGVRAIGDIEVPSGAAIEHGGAGDPLQDGRCGWRQRWK